jgi:hypothetical protein
MRTDDEIRAAAERLRALPANYPWECVNLTSQAWADCRTLAHAYLNPWRPIDSAPRDGTYVLVTKAGSNGSPIVARYDFQWGWLTLPGKYAAEPTHYMPLPPAPAG